MPPAVAEAALPPLPPTPDQIAGTPPFRVTWEGLSRSRPGGTSLGTRMAPPTGLKAPPPEMKIVLINASHPQAVRMRLNALDARSQRYEAEVAVVPDEDMLALLRDFEQLRFFDLARPTDAVQAQFASDQSRGRVTVERGGESVTLLFQYGQGRQEATKAIPAVYVHAKNLVAVLKNRTPHLSVTRVQTSHPRKPEPPPR